MIHVCTGAIVRVLYAPILDVTVHGPLSACIQPKWPMGRVKVKPEMQKDRGRLDVGM